MSSPRSRVVAFRARAVDQAEPRGELDFLFFVGRRLLEAMELQVRGIDLVVFDAHALFDLHGLVAHHVVDQAQVALDLGTRLFRPT